MALNLVKKRDGRIVEFDVRKIEMAITKAFEAVNEYNGILYIPDIVASVVKELEQKYGDEKIPSVEDIQDIVERKIAEAGFFDVAKAYILYRKEREKIRKEKQQKLFEQIDRGEITVTKRDGSRVPFDINELSVAIKAICSDYADIVDAQEVIEQVKKYIYDGIKTHEINLAIVLVLRGWIEKDPIYSFAAARALLNTIYKEVIGKYEFEEDFMHYYRMQFISSIKHGVEQGRYRPELLEKFDLERLAKTLDITRDRIIKYLGLQTLYDRYLMRDYDQKIIEVPQYFWMRVAMGLALNEKSNHTDWAIKFYNLMSTLRYVPSTPTLFHSGTPRSQMSSCYILTVEDDLDHIFKSIRDVAVLAKWSGGIGIDWTNVRATGALIKSINVHSQGVIPFLKILDATTAAINRSGKRRGATCAYLELWHYDIEDFLELRKNTGDERRRTHDLNTAVWVPDLFMKRLINNETWTLFSPDETPELHHTYGSKLEEIYTKYEQLADEGKIRLFKKIPAKKLWRKLITMLYETGHPWITFKDPCNVRSPQDHAGMIYSSNLCTEITLNTSRDEHAVCNLGSVNMSRHIDENGEIDWNKLRDTVKLAVRMLDNVIDLNFYPTKEAENANLRHRAVGLGMMGLQDVLFKKRIPFDTWEAVELSDKIMEFISYYAILSSSELAKERGTYSSYKGSKWDRGLLPIDTIKLLEEERDGYLDMDTSTSLDWSFVREHIKKYGMRNSNVMAIAPTATIANISGCFPSIEPIYKNIYVKSNASGEFVVINEYLVEDLKRLELWNDETRELLKYHDGRLDDLSLPAWLKRLYKTAFDIDPSWVIEHASRRAKWLDQSQSINIWTNSESGSFVSNIYTSAWRKGLKTTYYLRTLGASAIEKASVDIIKHEKKGTEDQPTQQVIQIGNIDIDGETCESCQ
ncbi:MAG: ribonucleoside-diphosphate reductase subunit alpha [Chlorobi bacterium]|nr:ribonucleoside-diphosphate reductase subunit alpha [Chlorobiota bacterium]